MLGRVFLGRYEILQLLGEGGMGKVYLAQDLKLGRQVVVKVMHEHVAADPNFRERFKRETDAMALFQHPYAVTLYDASPSDPQGSCIIMEYIKGISLDVLLQRHRKLEPARVSRLLGQLCEVLQAAHNEGVIHRDLKPANLMVVEADTPHEMLKVMDFGLAKLLGPMAQVSITNADFAVGTPGYMCPEQARGEEMDHRGDLYSVGVILFELLTGRLPFAGGNTMDVLVAHATEEPPSFAAIGSASGVSPALERVVRSCLAKDPNQRPRHARELAEMYNSALKDSAGEVSAGSGRPPTRNRLSVRGLMTPSSPPSPTPPLARPPSREVRPKSSPHFPPPEPVALKPPAPVAVAAPAIDPLAVVHHLEAWMPEVIATRKLRDFIHDTGAELIESVPGKIQIRLGGKGSVYTAPSRGLSWLGLGRRSNSIDVELRLNRSEGRSNQLRVTVIFRSPGSDISIDLAWRDLCTRIFCDLRGYLMGQTGALGAD